MRLLISIFIITSLLSCRENHSNPEVQALYDEVMFVHDEVMPEMSTIHRLKKQIRKLPEQDSLCYDLIKQLDEADEAMMSWMAQFKTDKEASDQEKINYLKEEKNKITEVSRLMKTSISDATSFLENKEHE